MKYGITMPPFGPYAEPTYLVGKAQEAEEAGWDGFFLWDHMLFNADFHPMLDPWIALGAMANVTKTIRLGTMITPLARRRPWKVARETVTLDRLSNGRVILGVGLGSPVEWEFEPFGEVTDARQRAAMLDESLAIITGLWSGEPFSFEGDHYNLDRMAFRPTAIQEPHIPIWIGGMWPNKAPMRRAARHNGVFPLSNGGQMTPSDFADARAYVEKARTSDEAYDYVASGMTPADDAAAGERIVEPYIEAGATWWLETVDPWSKDRDWSTPLDDEAVAAMNERIAAGPPRI